MGSWEALVQLLQYSKEAALARLGMCCRSRRVAAAVAQRLVVDGEVMRIFGGCPCRYSLAACLDCDLNEGQTLRDQSRVQ